MRRNLLLIFTFALLVATTSFAQAPFGALAESHDASLARLNDEIPGFGGMFTDEAGVLNVYLTDPGKADLTQRFGAGVRVLPASYEFRQLHGWRLGMRSLLARPEVVSLDVDETRNGLRVGIDATSPWGAERALLSELARLGVPAEAVSFEEVEPFVEMSHNLRDAFNPVPGGVEIGFSNFVCTLGFNATVAHADACYFLTNDHCSNIQGVTENTQYFQPFGGTFLGVEKFDPPFFTGGVCPAGRRCRYSDAIIAAYNNSSMCEFGAIAKTFLNSIVVDPSMPRWKIVGKNYSPAGRHIKEGRTTGRTQGPLTGTCVDVNVSGSNITRLCQNIVGVTGGPVLVGGGDSGSPVFLRASDAGVEVELVGILWGGSGSGDIFVYSPIRAVESEIGVILNVN